MLLNGCSLWIVRGKGYELPRCFVGLLRRLCLGATAEGAECGAQSAGVQFPACQLDVFEVGRLCAKSPNAVAVGSDIFSVGDL